MRRQDGGRLDRSLRVSQPPVDPLASFLQQASCAFLTQAHTIQQLGRGPFLALIDAFGNPRHLLANVIDGVGGTAFGACDPFGQAFGDTGDFRAQLLQRLSMAAVGLAQPLLNGAGHARDFHPDLIEGLSAAMFRSLDLAVERVGHLQDLLTHLLDRLRGLAFGNLNMTGHVAQGALQAIHASARGRLDLLDQIEASLLHLLGEFAGQLLEANIAAVRLLKPRLGSSQTVVEVGEGTLQAADGFGGARFGLFQPFSNARHDRVDHALGAGFSCGGFLPQYIQIAAQDSNGLAGARLAFVELAGDLVQRQFQRTHGVGRTVTDRLLLYSAQTLGGSGLIGANLIQRALKTSRHLGLFPLGVFHPREHAQNRLIYAADRQGRTMLGRFNAGR